MKCPKCGLENIHGAMYCEDCGTLLKTREVPAVSAAPPPPPRRQAAPRYSPPSPAPYGEESPRYAVPTVPVKPLSVQCPKCRKENMMSAVYCGGCGISLTGMGGIADSPNCWGKVSPLGGGVEFYLDRDRMLIGRRSEGDGNYPEIDLTVQDTTSSVSRRHAMLVRDDVQVFVEDLGSSNGTFHNDTRVTEGVQQSVGDGDTVRFGSLSFVFRKLK